MSCLIIILDGCNENYISRKLTPFLYHLKKTGSYVKMDVTPTFATRVELLTGNFPSTTDTFVDFCFDPEGSPFKFFRFLNIPVNLDKQWLIKTRFLMTLLYYLVNKTWVDFGNTPLSLLPYFSVNESLGKFKRKEKERSADHLFGILEENGFDVRFVYGDVKTLTKKVKGYSIDNNSVLILHYEDLDKIGHKYGPNSSEIRELLKTIDTSIRESCNLSKSDFIMVFGDHNMVEIKQNIDLWKKLKKLDVDLIDDYLVFLNSPMARFWFKNEDAERKIREFLESLCVYGREITKEVLTEWEIPTSKKYGEVIFWAKKGVNISPDFYHSSKIRGMHGYFDRSAKTPLIVFLRDRKIRLRKEARMVDVMPTILDLLGIQEIKVDGKSLLEDG